MPNVTRLRVREKITVDNTEMRTPRVKQAAKPCRWKEIVRERAKIIAP